MFVSKNWFVINGNLYAKKYIKDLRYVFPGTRNNTIWITYYNNKRLTLPFSSIDLIQENNVDRFEKKNRGNRNKNQNRPNNNNQNNQNQQGQKKNNNRPERQERPERSEKSAEKLPRQEKQQQNPKANSNNNQPRQQKPQQPKAQLEKAEAATTGAEIDKKPNPNKKKFKKKFPPKKDNNA